MISTSIEPPEILPLCQVPSYEMQLDERNWRTLNFLRTGVVPVKVNLIMWAKKQDNYAPVG